MQAVWMLLSAACFAGMGVCVKFASIHYNASELVFYRGIISVLIMLAVLRGQDIEWRTHIPGQHLWRCSIGVFSLGTWFYALAELPLATAITLNYMSSVWVALLAWVTSLWWGLRSSRGSPKAFTTFGGHTGPLGFSILASFAGVVLMLRPTVDTDQWFAALVGIVSGVSSAVVYLKVRSLTQAGEPITRTVLFFSLASVLAGAAGMGVQGNSGWNTEAAAWLLPLGVLASAGQMCMTRGYSLGPTLVAANLQYAGIVFGALFSVAFFNDPITLWGWAGMTVIMVSGIWATWLQESSPSLTAES
ncbi:MAG: DMT family transporter [Betaproteobacteria bacterium]|nr:DMT family transporter [Betaproteobacteria bacterium]NBY05048.1 DMT family transporter [Betaproteobacteria bacterium]